MTTAFAIAMVPWCRWSTPSSTRAWPASTSEFFTNSMFRVVGEGGGAYHAIVGTLIVTVLATLISVPIGLMTADLPRRVRHRPLKRAITFFVDVMTGIPSIVAGLFAFALFTLLFGNDVRMGVMGAVALSVLMIPVVVRSCEEVLKLVPNERGRRAALGVPKWRTVVKVVLRRHRRPRNGRHPVRRPRRRGDRPAAGHRRAHHVDQLQSVRRADGHAAGVRVLPADPARDRHPAFLDRAWTAASY